MKFGKIGVIIIGLVPFNVYAECTPAPDCASIGYTETSCEGDFVKCPFDTSKLFCIPCDSSFKYDCSGENITGGTGSACGGKYVSCECVTNYIFDNGSCICPEIAEADCLVGAIYYPDGKCSNDYVACLNPVGVVVKDNALVMSWRKSSNITWASNTTTNTSLTDITPIASVKTDYDGKNNTAVIVATYSNDTIENNAAVYCYNYAPTGMESSKGQWYLPAAGEVYDYIYGNHTTLNTIYTTHLGSFVAYYWTSSEYSTDYAWCIHSTGGNMYGNGSKGNYQAVSCFLALQLTI